MSTQGDQNALKMLKIKGTNAKEMRTNPYKSTWHAQKKRVKKGKQIMGHA